MDDGSSVQVEIKAKWLTALALLVILAKLWSPIFQNSEEKVGTLLFQVALWVVNE